MPEPLLRVVTATDETSPDVSAPILSLLSSVDGGGCRGGSGDGGVAGLAPGDAHRHGLGAVVGGQQVARGGGAGDGQAGPVPLVGQGDGGGSPGSRCSG